MANTGTGKPVPSEDVRDLLANATNLDEGINGDAFVWKDRFNRDRRSWVGLEHEFDAFKDSNRVYGFPTWDAAAAAVAAGRIPVESEVNIVGDAGTHVDPVTGSTVSNSGRFTMMAGGLQWRSADALAMKADRTEVATLSKATSPTPRDSFRNRMRLGEIGTGFDQQVVGTAAPAAGSTSGTATYVPAGATTHDGYLSSVTASMRDGVATTLCLYAPDAQGVLRTVGYYEVRSVPNTVNTWSVEAGDLPAGVFLRTGARIGIRRKNDDGKVGVLAGSLGDGFTIANDTGVGAAVSVVASSSIPQINMTVAWATDTAEGRIAGESGRARAMEDAIRAQLGKDTSTTVTAVVGVAAPANGSTPSASIRGPAQPVASPGYLRSLRAYMRNGTSATVHIFVPDGAGGFLLKSSTQVTCVVGLNTWTVADGHLPDTFLPAGAYVGIGPGADGVTGVVAFAAGTGTNSRVWTAGAIGGAATFTGSTTVMQMRMEVTTADSPLQAQLDDLKARVPNYPPSIVTFGPTPQAVTRFPGTAVPVGWGLNGWTVSDGLVPPAVPGRDSPALSRPYSFVGRRRTRVRFRVLDVNSRFGICFDPTGPGSVQYGTLALVDGAAGQLQIYPWAGVGNDIGSPGKTMALGFALVAGREYLLDVIKQRMKATVTLRDSVTGATVTMEAGPGFGALGGRQWGRAGISLITGNVKVLSFDCEVPCPSAPHAIIIGDSNTEGSALGADYSRAWGYQIEDARGDNRVLVAARGGATSTNILGHLAADLTPYRPRYVVPHTGANDGAVDTWAASMGQVVVAILATGATPVFGTLLPNDGAVEKTTAINDIIRNGYFGPYPFIDFSLACSNEGDMTTWNPAFRADALHANAAGQDRMVLQARIDAPFLFD